MQRGTSQAVDGTSCRKKAASELLRFVCASKVKRNCHSTNTSAQRYKKLEDGDTR